MACMQEVTCSAKECGKKFNENINRPGAFPYICEECRGKEKDAKWLAHLAELQELPIEERFQRIERWIFEYKPPRRKRMY